MTTKHETFIKPWRFLNLVVLGGYDLARIGDIARKYVVTLRQYFTIFVPIHKSILHKFVERKENVMAPKPCRIRPPDHVVNLLIKWQKVWNQQLIKLFLKRYDTKLLWILCSMMQKYTWWWTFQW